MIYRDSFARKLAINLLETQAVILKPDSPFTWASGWKSPIYCDNRLLLSYPDIRKDLISHFVSMIKEKFPDANAVSGVATAGIAHAAMIAHELDLPLSYVRSSAKQHGRGNKIEGRISKNSRVIVVEDLISTGGSSLKAVEALRSEGAEVVSVIAIFNYGFQISEQAFKAANCPLVTLSSYPILIETAIEKDYIRESDLSTLTEWRSRPQSWDVPV